MRQIVNISYLNSLLETFELRSFTVEQAYSVYRDLHARVGYGPLDYYAPDVRRYLRLAVKCQILQKDNQEYYFLFNPGADYEIRNGYITPRTVSVPLTP